MRNESPLPAAAAAEAGRETSRALLAEDNPIHERDLRQALSARGYTVTVARNGPDALAMALADGFDVIVLDVSLPGLPGLDVAIAVREAEPIDGQRAAICITHPHELCADNDRYRRAGIDGFIPKPIRDGELSEVLDRALARSPA